MPYLPCSNHLVVKQLLSARTGTRWHAVKATICHRITWAWCVYGILAILELIPLLPTRAAARSARSPSAPMASGYISLMTEMPEVFFNGSGNGRVLHPGC